MIFMTEVTLHITDESYASYADACAALIETAAKEPDAALALRTPEYLLQKINQGKAIIALDSHKAAVGFCYIEAWEDGAYIANSGLVVNPAYRGQGLASRIKQAIFDLSRKLFPDATLFGLTTSPAVMSVNANLGYQCVSFKDITTDDAFWKGCESCRYHDILVRLNRANCLCTAMVQLPQKKK